MDCMRIDEEDGLLIESVVLLPPAKGFLDSCVVKALRPPETTECPDIAVEGLVPPWTVPVSSLSRVMTEPASESSIDGDLRSTREPRWSPPSQKPHVLAHFVRAV